MPSVKKVSNKSDSTSNLAFSKAIAEKLYNSSDDFPVSFNAYWQCLGYTRKDNAKRGFLNSDLVESIDYILLISEKAAIFNVFGDSEQDILMTIDAFKDWGMMARTSEGKQIRAYFIEVEKTAKEFAKNWKSNNESFKIADDAVKRLKEVQKLHPVTYQMAIQALGGAINSNALELADTSSLVANRLGLAFNKQIKAFEKLSDATSPDAFDSLKEAYYKLAEDYSELLKLKTAQPTIEYVEKIVEKVVIQKEVVEVPSGNPLVEYALRSENNDLKVENKDLQRQLNNLWDIYNKSQGNYKSSQFQLPPGKRNH